MALPDAWVDHLFSKLAVRYGDAWIRKWEGIPIAAVRADWAQVLGGLDGNALTYGLANLPPDYPPTAAAFRQACNARPLQDQLPQLPPPTAVQRERLEQLRAGLAEALAPKDPRAWAQRLLQRAQAGHATPTPAALDMARSTLRARPDELATADYRNPRDAT
jgi:hypothetical protein